MNVGVSKLIAEARRRKGLTQSRVADAIGCRQSAISMFENGRRDALSGEKLSALSKLLDVDATKPDAVSEPVHLAYCPEPLCPSNVPYALRGQTVFHPTLVVSSREGPTYCPLCGEVMETQCPNAECRAAPQPGAFCRRCGSPYINAETAARGQDTVGDAQLRTRSLLELTAMLDARLSKKETAES